jgi:hypothetical protein
MRQKQVSLSQKTHVCAQQIRVHVVFAQDLKAIRQPTCQHNYQSEKIRSTIHSSSHSHFQFYSLREAAELKFDGDIQACLYRRTHLWWLRHCGPHPRSYATLYEIEAA